MDVANNLNYLGIGKVFHARKRPKIHRFSMSVYMLFISLHDEKNTQQDLKLGKISKFIPRDYWNKTCETKAALQQALIDEWQRRGLNDVQRVCVLTNPRTFNTAMNPLSVFYCYRNEELVGIIAEVTNTPWGERHHYFLLISDDEHVDCTAKGTWKNRQLRFEFQKNMHVSPFNPVDLTYEMRFLTTDKKVSVIMQLSKERETIFDASLYLTMTPLDNRAWRRAFWRRPWLTMQVRLRIYFEAFKLACKGVPFYKHPKKITANTTRHRPDNTSTQDNHD